MITNAKLVVVLAVSETELRTVLVCCIITCQHDGRSEPDGLHPPLTVCCAAPACVCASVDTEDTTLAVHTRSLQNLIARGTRLAVP